jgi:hypothetical protein
MQESTIGFRLKYLPLLLIYLYSQGISAELQLLEPTTLDEWISPVSKVRFTLDEGVAVTEGNYAILLGTTDVTALFHQTASGEFQYTSTVLPLPSGESVLKVFRIDGKEWIEIGQASLRILTDAGYESSETNPRLDISVDSQLDEGHSEDAGEPERSRYTDVTMNAGLSLERARGDTSVRSDINLVGSSVQEQALRYFEKGDEAAKVDLSDYVVELNKGDSTFTLGHSSFGQNPLLISSISNRGMTFRHRFSDSFDFSLASQNGSSIVGFNNLLGLRSFDHNISGGTLGYEVIASRPGAFRMEVSYVTAEIQSDLNFDVGEVPDAEESAGYGIRLLGSSESGRFRGELNYARSAYTNPEDAALNQGIDDVVAVNETTNSAYRVNLGYDILTGNTTGDSTPISLTMSLRHERIDPLYKTLAAFPSADVLKSQLEFVSQIGTLSLQLQHTWMEDNLDDLASILKTKTESTVFSAVYDFSELAGDESLIWLWPSASLSLNRVRQYAGNNPDADISGFNGRSHLPDQNNVSGDLGLSWNLDNWGLAYTYSYSNQDNRQVGREQDDFKTDEVRNGSDGEG